MSAPESGTGGIRPPGEGPRNGKGKFIRSPDTSERDAQAWRLKVQGLTDREIAEKMGYAEESGARKAIDRARAEGQSRDTDELRDIELARTEELYQMARKIANKDRPVVSHGKVMYDIDGTKLIDDSQKLSAMDRMLKAMERKAKYVSVELEKKNPELSLALVQEWLRQAEERARQRGELP